MFPDMRPTAKDILDVKDLWSLIREDVIEHKLLNTAPKSSQHNLNLFYNKLFAQKRIEFI